MGAKGSPTDAREKARQSIITSPSEKESCSILDPKKEFLSYNYRDWGISLIIFFAALFLIISVTNPAIYLNDEWITANQVHQLDLGHQITINEGKYGVFKNGTPGPYFAKRANVLMYSLALPLASLPVLKIFGLFTDNFRMAVITLWAFLPFFAALIFSMCFPSRSRIGSLRITIITAATGFLLIALNLPSYTQFIWSAPDAPIEVAAVIFCNHILFALTMSIMYLIARTIFTGEWKALFAVIATGSCSAFLFWGANAKDHMATAFVFSLILLFLIRYLKTRCLKDAAVGFFFIGILAWVRPEVGFSAFLCFSIFIIVDNFLRMCRGIQSTKDEIIHSITPLATLLGAVPFFVNNLIISGNPLTPAFLVEEKIKNNAELVQIVPVDQSINISQSVTTNPLAIGNDLLGTIGHFFFSVSPNPGSDIYGILFFPASQSMGLFLVSPLALLTLLLLPLIYFLVKDDKNHRRIELVIFLLIASCVVILAYLHNLNGLNASHGIGPDIRYLSPLYLPIILLSLVLLERTILFAHPKKLVTYSLILGFTLVPIILVAIMLIYPAVDRNISEFLTLFKILIPFEVIMSLGITVGYHFAHRKPDWITDLLLPILVITVLAWQITMVFLLLPVTKFNGYPQWLPIVESLYNIILRTWAGV
jgi:hypothetical protein